MSGGRSHEAIKNRHGLNYDECLELITATGKRKEELEKKLSKYSKFENSKDRRVDRNLKYAD